VGGGQASLGTPGHAEDRRWEAPQALGLSNQLPAPRPPEGEVERRHDGQDCPLRRQGRWPQSRPHSGLRGARAQQACGQENPAAPFLAPLVRDQGSGKQDFGA
jgi:hypothetical protein